MMKALSIVLVGLSIQAHAVYSGQPHHYFKNHTAQADACPTWPICPDEIHRG